MFLIELLPFLMHTNLFFFHFLHFSLLSEVLCWPGFLVFGAIFSSALIKVIHFIVIGRGGRNISDIVRPVWDTWDQSAGYWCSPMSTLTNSLCSKMSMPCQSSQPLSVAVSPNLGFFLGKIFMALSLGLCTCWHPSSSSNDFLQGFTPFAFIFLKVAHKAVGQFSLG